MYKSLFLSISTDKVPGVNVIELANKTVPKSVFKLGDILTIPGLIFPVTTLQATIKFAFSKLKRKGPKA